MTEGHTPDLIERLRDQSTWRDAFHRCIIQPEMLTEATDEITALRDRVAALEGALEYGLSHLSWINAQAENAMANASAVIATTEDGAVSLMMLDSIASDIGINAVMAHDKLTAILSRAQQGGGDV